MLPIGNKVVPKIIIYDTINLFFKLQCAFCSFQTTTVSERLQAYWLTFVPFFLNYRCFTLCFLILDVSVSKPNTKSLIFCGLYAQLPFMTHARFCITAQVKVTVDDVNDCSPTWVFPRSPENDTVHVSFGFGFDRVALATLVAKDADDGDNARLTSVSIVSF